MMVLRFRPTIRVVPQIFKLNDKNVTSLSTLLDKEENVFTLVLSSMCRIQADQELSKRTVHLMVEAEVRLLALFSKLVLILKTSTRDIIANTRAYFPVKPKFFSDSFSEPQANQLGAKIKCPLFCVSTLLIQFIQCFYKMVQWQQFH